jgi:hypothetical protein
MIGYRIVITHILDVTSTLQTVYVKHSIDIRFVIPLFGIITKLKTCVLIVKEKPSAQLLPFT